MITDKYDFRGNDLVSFFSSFRWKFSPRKNTGEQQINMAASLLLHVCGPWWDLASTGISGSMFRRVKRPPDLLQSVIRCTDSHAC